MAGMSNADPLHHLTVDASPPPIPKDMQGSDNSVPLSPQWLLPKLGDTKLGQTSVEKRTDLLKPLGYVEDLNAAEKKIDVFRPSFYDTGKVRRDCWADEEREANPAMRRDLRKEVEELGDTRKLERWSNSSSSKYSSETRHFPSERWSGIGSSGSRENAYEPRRESKWNPRWGPDDKEAENWRDKFFGKDGELSHYNYKGAYHQTTHAKDTKYQGKDTDKEGEHYSRAWRPSPAVNRGRGETNLYLPSTTNKSASMFGYGRGKGDTGAPVLSVDRTSVGSGTSNASGDYIHQFSLVTAADRSNGSHKNLPGLRYSRMKLFDIYRLTDLKGYRNTFEGFQDFPSLIQADHLVPLAFISPISEERVIMDAIEKGELLSSGVPQASIDSSSGKNYLDSGLLPLTKPGIGEDAPHVVSGYRDERTNHGKDGSFYFESDVHDKFSRVLDSKVPSSESLGRYQEVTLTSEETKSEVAPSSTHISSREGNKLEKTTPWRSPSVGGWSLSSWDSAEVESGSSNMGWLNKREEILIEPRSKSASSSSHIGGDPQNPANLQSNMWIESQIKRLPSKTIEQDQGDPFTLREKLKDQKFQQYLSPEQLSLFYKDPQGQIQGPFSGSNLIEWFDAGYFGINLLVRLANAPPDTPFSMLGDVIPQLRTRVRPPPGFGSTRQNDIVEVSNRGKVGGAVGSHLSISDLDLVKKGQVLGNESKVEAENRFLESLMAARFNNSFLESNLLSEGMQGYNGLTGSRHSTEVDNLSDMKYLFHKMPLDQQSLLTSYLPGSDHPAILSKADSLREVPVPSNTLSQIGEIPHQHVDLLSLLQSATNKTHPPPVNSAFPVWPNFSEVQTTKITHGSIDIMKDTSGLHSDQQSSQTRFGTLPNKLQTQFQPPLSNQYQTPFFGFSSGTIPPEKPVAIDINHDAQMANLLRHQYMLNQHLHSQVQHPAHLNQMELLLLMQRQKLEQQQQQQYQLLSHALSGHHLRNCYDEQSFGILNTEAIDADAAMKSPIQLMHEVAPNINSSNVIDSKESYASVGLSNLNLHLVQDAVSTCGIENSSLNLPNNVIDHKSHSNETNAHLLNVEPTRTTSDEIASIPNKSAVVSLELPQINENVTIASNAVKGLVSSEKGDVSLDLEPFASDMVGCGKISLSTTSKQAHSEIPVSKVLDDTESKVLDDTELREVKKTSEKKSRKHKNSQSLKVAPGQKVKHFEGVAEKDVPMEETKPLNKPTIEPLMESLDSHSAHMSSEVVLDNISKIDEAKSREVEFVRPSSNNMAWKPAPGQKVKSLLEIQVEEQNRAQIQSFSSDTIPNNMPANVSITSELKYAVDIVQCDSSSQSVSENPEKFDNPWKLRNRSQLHDVFSEEILPEVSGCKSEEKGTYSPILPVQNETAVDHDFIEAKDTRKGRKKAAKNKGVASKLLLKSNSAGLSPSLSITEETITPLQPQQEKELLPSPPPAPSLGDFVFWKGDHANTILSPVWSTDSVKVQKPANLKDIFKEQDKNTKSGQQQIPIQIPKKVQTTKMSGGGRSLGKLASPIKTSSIALGQQKKEMEDDLFWGPLSQVKQGTRLDHPSHADTISDKLKGGTPVKIAGEGSSKNALSTKLAENSTVTSSPSIKQSSSKGKKDSESKNSEATDFRDWCEAEWFRLTGTNDTSFLEFCLKQTTSEAEALLRENVASLDRGNEFIDKFVNYKKFLPTEIIETTFQVPTGSSKASKNTDAEADDGAGLSKVKKKGKKGKKVSPALLGFNVVSNRIMMGEIQTIED